MNPIEFEPILKRIRWGGTRLGTMLGKSIGSETDYAESWEICDHGKDQSIVASGVYKGWSLQKLVQEKSDEIFGQKDVRTQFPLLIKFLDCNDRLSVQVHPNDSQATKFDQNENGKTEAWVVVSAQKNSFIYAGLKKEVTPALLQSAISHQTVEDCLHRITPKPGDCFYIPAGTVHAIGEGVVIAEIQQSSDLTFRLYDWGRTDTNGLPRTLHIEQAIECIDFDCGPVQNSEPVLLSETKGSSLELLVDSEYFRIEQLKFTDRYCFSPEPKCRVLMNLSGEAIRFCSEGNPTQFSTGNTLLIPASCKEFTMNCQSKSACQCLIATVS